MNIWGKPAENFAMLANRGQEIFVEASLRQEKVCACAQLEFNVIMDKDLVETTARSGDFLENWDVGG